MFGYAWSDSPGRFQEPAHWWLLEPPRGVGPIASIVFINFNIITRNYCLKKTILILFVAFLLSVSICSDML